MTSSSKTIWPLCLKSHFSFPKPTVNVPWFERLSFSRSLLSFSSRSFSQQRKRKSPVTWKWFQYPIVPFRKKDLSRQRQKSKELRNITDLLDTLLLGYDNHLRPDFGGEFWHSVIRLEGKANWNPYWSSLLTNHELSLIVDDRPDYLRNNWRKAHVVIELTADLIWFPFCLLFGELNFINHSSSQFPILSEYQKEVMCYRMSASCLFAFAYTAGLLRPACNVFIIRHVEKVVQRATC